MMGTGSGLTTGIGFGEALGGAGAALTGAGAGIGERYVAGWGTRAEAGVTLALMVAR